MPAELLQHVLHRGDVATIAAVRCRACAGEAHGEECATRDEIVFPRRGLFLRHVGRRTAVGDPCSAMLFRAGQGYRVSHPIAGGDDCTVISFSPAVWREAMPSRDDRSDRDAVPVTPAMVWVHQQLRREAASGNDPLTIEEAALSLLRTFAGSLSAADGERDRRPHRRAGTSRAHADLAADVRALLASAFAAPMSLSQVARRVGASPYHLARVFRDQTGLSVHACRERLRLTAALDRLADDPRADLTRLALDLGYSSHAHFTTRFARAFGRPPSRFRESSTIVEAARRRRGRR